MRVGLEKPDRVKQFTFQEFCKEYFELDAVIIDYDPPLVRKRKGSMSLKSMFVLEMVAAEAKRRQEQKLLTWDGPYAASWS